MLIVNQLQERSPKDYEMLCTSLRVDEEATTLKFLEKSAGLTKADAAAVVTELHERCTTANVGAEDLVTPEIVRFACQSIDILGVKEAHEGFVGSAPPGVSTTEAKRAFDEIANQC